MDASKKHAIALTDKERFPLLSDLSYLNKLKQDAFAPKFNFQSGDRLQQHHLQQVQAYAEKIKATKVFWREGMHPDWLGPWLKWCIETVPFYKGRHERLENQPTINREDLHLAPWQFVSSDGKLEDLLVYETSGTTRSPMDVMFEPASQACWIPQLESVLNLYDINLTGHASSTSIALICAQEKALTYASLSTYLKGAGVLKINLNPNDWWAADHRIKYLEHYNPEILTGDPFAFLSLVELKPKLSPKALVSSAMKLTNGIRKKLETYFNCPVLDIYSLTECRMIAVAENEQRHRAIRPELYLEVFDKDKDILLPPGERGELVITGGNNPFLPLIRYRTGDFCSLYIEHGIPYLIDLEARHPVAFYNAKNKFINYIDISRAMNKYPLAGFNLHQNVNKSLRFTGWGTETKLKHQVLETLQHIFGNELPIEVVIHPPAQSSGLKPVAFSSDLDLNLN